MVQEVWRRFPAGDVVTTPRGPRRDTITGLKRRTFLQSSAGATLAGLANAQTPPIPVIDTHIHLFDVSRPQGVPWPPKDDKVLYKTALPERYRKLAVPLGIVGAIEIEASPWLDDNQWVLDIAAKDKIIVGTVGDIEPGAPGFRKNVERFPYTSIRCFEGIPLRQPMGPRWRYTTTT